MILDRIVSEKILEVERLKEKKRSLFDSLGGKDLSIIAEIKKASPSKGIIAEKFDPREQLQNYEKGGASAVSVLTDKPFFQGSGAILRDLSEMSTLPLLRKDFLIDPLQVEESYFLGADAVLLITSILTGKRLEEMLEKVHSMGMEALVEVHDEKELIFALESSAGIIGINNRNLKDFSVDLSNTEKLIKKMEDLGARPGKRVVSESGINSTSDAIRAQEAGADGILVGESIMRSSNPVLFIEELRGGCSQ